MFRTRKTQKKYQKVSENNKDCPFCQPNLNNRIIIETRRSVVVTKNDFGYSLWEGRQVMDHLMAVPTKHVANFNDLTKDEKIEMFETISHYEAIGYDIYARGAGSKQKTIPGHLHTHLIKTIGRPANFILYLKKPYNLVRF